VAAAAGLREEGEGAVQVGAGVRKRRHFAKEAVGREGVAEQTQTPAAAAVQLACPTKPCVKP
jgi:hypothetical protein